MLDLNHKVSIITVVYNGVNTIEQTIKSVFGQTYKNIEYIVIDGGSTDGTQQIIEKHLDKISYYVSEEDEGLYYAMNKGIKKATGEIVGIINSDDWYDINAVKNIVECFCNSEADLVYGKTVIVAENGTETVKEVGELQTIWYNAPFLHASVFIKKNIYDKLGVFNVKYKIASDYDLLLRFYVENIKFEYLKKNIAYFRLGGLSTTQKRVGYDECRSISLTYTERCPYGDKMLLKINEVYDWRCFIENLSDDENLLSRLLCKYFHKNIKNIVIFGTGSWGERCFQNLINTGIDVTCFSDNNSVKWNTEFCDTKVISPKELQNMDTYVLIAVKYHGEKIKKQLTYKGNGKLQCVCIKEIQEIQ